MDQKIAELTEKLYKEGVEKGEEQKKSILETARVDATRIKEDAQKEAEKILADAVAQAQEMKRNAESEIKLSSQQAISALKQKICDELLVTAVDENVSATLSDPAVMKELIATIVKNWNVSGNEVPSLEILLPDTERSKLEKAVSDSLKKVMKDGFSISFVKSIKGGFQIGPKEGSFKISLKDEDFIEFFKDYLRPKTRNLLFKE